MAAQSPTLEPNPAQVASGMIMLLIMSALIVGSFLAWRHFISVRTTTAWKRIANFGRPLATIGLVDILAAIACMFLVQVFTLVIIQATTGIKYSKEVVAAAVQQSTRDVVDSIEKEHVTETTPTPAPESTPSPVEASSEPIEHTKKIQATKDSESKSKLPPWIMLVANLSSLVFVAAMTAFVVLRTNCSLSQIGWRSDQLRGDFLFGAVAFLMFTPIILVLNVLTMQISGVPYSHPILDAMSESPWLFPLAFCLATIVAPFTEEFIFRGLLIGWIESIMVGTRGLLSVFNGEPSTPPQLPSEPTYVTSVDVSASQVGQLDHTHSNELLNHNSIAPSWIPPAISGLAFGLMHFNYGVSWIPLVVFGIILGRIYQLRQSLWPCIALHALHNSLSMVGLALHLISKQ